MHPSDFPDAPEPKPEPEPEPEPDRQHGCQNPKADHGPYHHHHNHQGHHHAGEKRWLLTRAMLSYAESIPLLHAVLLNPNSRKIFFFMILNFSFMVVQAFYGYLTDSLGLISDSIHMFFDCVALFVGLLAAVASKWPPSRRFPYGFGKMEILSGFANGVLLILLSIEITFEAFERLRDGTKTKRLSELFVVSTLGLVVNLVGMLAFGHHHHHHHHHQPQQQQQQQDGYHGDARSADHHHGHHGNVHLIKHGHDHHGEAHSADPHHHHSDPHPRMGGPDGRAAQAGDCHHRPASLPAPGHGRGDHPHSHDRNENMHGIYLHIMADTLGSASVIGSTALTYFTGWSGWDPIASCVIALLIMASSRPLVLQCSRKLLLGVPDSSEYRLRHTLSGIMDQQGVVGYAVPKFWMDDDDGDDGGGDDDDGGAGRLLGVVHVVAARGASMEDVRQGVRGYLLREGVDAMIQLEREGESSCWCGVGRSALSQGGGS